MQQTGESQAKFLNDVIHDTRFKIVTFLISQIIKDKILFQYLQNYQIFEKLYI